MTRFSLTSTRVRVVAVVGVVLLIVVPVAWWWFRSLVPSTYSVMDMGYPDYGGGATDAMHDAMHHSGGGSMTGVSVATLTGPQDGTPAVREALVARKEPFRLASGERVSGYTLNHSSPGPTITATEGDLVEVTLVNESVRGGVTLHWHGVDVPNAEDGVAGVTQDAVVVGERHVYRFVVADAGTYWYHSHQVSHAQVRGGLFGTLVVRPKKAPIAVASDLPAVVHAYSGRLTVNGSTRPAVRDVPAGGTARVRVVNTDSGPLRVWVSGAAYRLLAVDGRDLHGPTPVRDQWLVVAAGGRADLAVATPADGSGARVELGGAATAVVLGPAGAHPAKTPQPRTQLDLLSYGTPAPIGLDPAAADRSFDYRIGRRPGFMDGHPGFWWTINGHVFPDVPMYVVAEGDIVRMRIKNTSGQVHPMHLHGHHAVVLSRNGVRATGSPWWVDSLNVRDGETYVIAFRADNPGIWMDHCHNLPHAQQGLVAHLAYVGVSEPYRVGDRAHNTPE